MSNSFESILEMIDHWIDLSEFTTKQLLFLAEAATYAAAEGGYCLEAAIQDLRLKPELSIFLGKTFDAWVDTARYEHNPMLIYTGLAIKCGNWVFTRYPQEVQSADPTKTVRYLHQNRL